MIEKKAISIIIPCINEGKNLQQLLPILENNLKGQQHEIIIADGGSSDHSAQIAKKYSVTFLSCPKLGRSNQMIEGVAISKYPILYFVHADTRPPDGFYDDILKAIGEGFPVGCFRFRFDSPNPLLKINNFFTRFNFPWCRGGDQSLYIERELYQKIGGFDPSYSIMEEYDLIARAQQVVPFKIIPKEVVVSARKYSKNGYLRVQIANLIAFRMFRKGMPHDEIKKKYHQMLDLRFE